MAGVDVPGDPSGVESRREAVRLDPGSPRAWKNLAVALTEAGRLPEAIQAVRSALRLRPRYLSALYLLAQLKTFAADDPDLRTLEVLAADEGGLQEREVMQLSFTLAKALEDVGDYERGFRYLSRANALKRSRLEYDIGADLRFMSRVQGVFGDDLFQRFSGVGSDTERPILIVGMPRSGTSLVEQVLASHPAVHGGGELGHLAEIGAAVAVLSDGRLGFPEGVAQVRPDDLARLGLGYDQRLQLAAGDVPRVTDKNPFNFAFLGLAELIVPRAHVIHCVREPLDTCLSCFKLDFAEVQFAFDLDELGRYYQGYAHLMDHWRRVLPSGWILDVSYERLVEDVERETRRMLAHCGLDWDERCLDFQRTERNVQTASFAQVRQPVHGRSVDRWRRYEPYLGRLIAALET
jgi:tetratricopeptide (TPR) repeat protein